MSQKRLLIFAFFAFFTSTTFNCSTATTSLYDQLIPTLLKNTNVENPSEEETNFINACRAHMDHGNKYAQVGSENWQAINSIEMYSSILPQYAQTLTASGYIALARQCAQMTPDVTKIAQRIKLLKYLEQNPEIFQRLNNIFTAAQPSEKTFYSLFRQMSDDEQSNIDKLHKKLYFSNPSLNESITALEVTPRYHQFMTSFTILAPAILSSGGYQVATHLDEFMQKNFVERNIYPYKEGILHLPKNTVKLVTKGIPATFQHSKTLYNFFKDNLVKNENYNPDSYTTVAAASGLYAVTVGVIGGYLSLLIWSAYRQCVDTKELLDLIHEKQRELISTAHLIKSMQVVHKTIQSDDKLQECMANEYKTLNILFDPKDASISADLKKLLINLLSSSFQGDDSYYFSQQGKILATHYQLNKIKGELVPFIEAFGQIDAYLSVNKLYDTYKNHPKVRFCIPEFVDAQTPVLDIAEYWHPLIDTNTVVTNSLSMNQSNAANLIITGPNAGGKTTSLMSLIINIIFAQSFGIAPCSSLRFTPFTKIHSYLDITTNLQEGLSLFAAEVDRAKKLKTSITSCNSGEKTFTIIDEIFSGTDPKVASEVGFDFAKQLGNMPHSMTIITTHFPALTELEEKTQRYTNYKVADATIHADGSISYPFKLVQGISSQNIAAQMLHNQGII